MSVIVGNSWEVGNILPIYDPRMENSLIPNSRKVD